MHLDGKGSVSFYVASGAPHVSVLGSLFILCASESFYNAGNHIVGYADDVTIYAAIPRLLSRP